MAKQFEINGIKYVAKDFDYNMICDFQDAGIDLKDMKKKAMSTARAYLAICSGMELPDAGNEIMQHMIKGGQLDEIFEVLGEALEAFFAYSHKATQQRKWNRKLQRVQRKRQQRQNKRV